MKLGLKSRTPEAESEVKNASHEQHQPKRGNDGGALVNFNVAILRAKHTIGGDNVDDG
jgi:hypothetical protein